MSEKTDRPCFSARGVLGVAGLGAAYGDIKEHILSAATKSGDARLRRYTVAAFCVLTLVAVAGAVTASPLGVRTTENARNAESETKQAVKAMALAETRLLRVFLGHTNAVYSVAFSSDGRRIVSGSWDKTLKVWDAATGQETLTLRGHTDLVRGVAFSPDGRQIVSGSDDKTLKIWDAATGREVRTLRGHKDGVRSLGVRPSIAFGQ